MKVVIIALLVLLLIALFELIVILCKRDKVHKLEEELNRKNQAYEGLQQEFTTLYEISKIRSEDKKEADEKKKDLYTGDPVDNAIAGLSKH